MWYNYNCEKTQKQKLWQNKKISNGDKNIKTYIVKKKPQNTKIVIKHKTKILTNP